MNARPVIHTTGIALQHHVHGYFSTMAVMNLILR